MVVGLHGACLGAGIELPAFAQRVVAADDARIALPEGSLGLIPGAGGTVSIRHRIGSRRTLDLIVSGRQIDAATAQSWGLVDEVVPRSELEARLQQLDA
jgi:enoyl-CoA hydratase/carnithine racemase